MGRTNPPRVKAGRFFFSQHRRRAVESDAAARNRDDVARVFRAAKHDSLDQIHRDRHKRRKNRRAPPSPQSSQRSARSRSQPGRGAPGEGRRRPQNVRPFQADQFAAISQRLPRICFSFHEVRSRRTESGWRLACRIRTRATSRAGRILGEKICVAAGTRGSFPTKQFKAARKNGRIRRHFRFNSPNGASNCTERRASEPCWILFSASVIPRSQRSAVASKKFIGFEIDDAYLAEAKRRIASGRGGRSRK